MIDSYTPPTSGQEGRLSALEADTRHLDARITTLDRNMQENFSSLRQLITQQKQPITAFAGWAAVILSLVFAFGAPLKEADNKIEQTAKDNMKTMKSEISWRHQRHQEIIDLLLSRELDDAYSRGQSDQTFKTIQEELDSAIKNRKDIDAKHLAAQDDLRRQIKILEHALDNGLGRRIEEKTLDIRNDLEWIKKRLDVNSGH